MSSSAARRPSERAQFLRNGLVLGLVTATVTAASAPALASSTGASDAAGPVTGFSTFYLFASGAAVGLATLLAFIPPRQIGSRFFILISLLAVVFYALAMLAGDMGLNYAHLAAAGCLIAFNVFLSSEGGWLARAVLAVAIACGAVGLWLDAVGFRGELPLAGSQPAWLFAELVTSSLLLGGAIVAMVLGHWYLVSPKLSFDVLRTVTLVLIVSLALRLVVIALCGVAQSAHWESLWVRAGGAVGFFAGSGLFVLVRALFGLALPVVLVYMVWDCVRIRSNQSATGILYVIVAFVLMGEILAKHLLVSRALLV